MRARILAGIAMVLVAYGCAKKRPRLADGERERAVAAADECATHVASLAPRYEQIQTHLVETILLNRAEAARLLRDSVELLITTRELACMQSQAIVQDILARAPGDPEVTAARDRVTAGVIRLAAARAAYDAALGAVGAPEPPPNEAELVDALSRALAGP